MAVGFTLAEYLENLRTYLKDKNLYNILLSFTEENTDDPELEIYIRMAIADVNMFPPYGVGGLFTVDNIENNPAVSLLIMEATWHALVSNSIVQARNDLPYNNGGVSLKVEDRNRYIPIINELWRNLLFARDQYKKYKITLNISSILGGSAGVPSPYDFLYHGYIRRSRIY